MAAAAKLRVGVLSTAAIATKNVSAARASGAVEIVAVASRDLDRAKAWAAAHDVPLALGSYDELLADASIEAVYVPLPTGLRKEWVIKVRHFCDAARGKTANHAHSPRRLRRRESMSSVRSLAQRRWRSCVKWPARVLRLVLFSWTESCLCTTRDLRWASLRHCAPGRQTRDERRITARRSLPSAPLPVHDAPHL